MLSCHFNKPREKNQCICSLITASNTSVVNLVTTDLVFTIKGLTPYFIRGNLEFYKFQVLWLN